MILYFHFRTLTIVTPFMIFDVSPPARCFHKLEPLRQFSFQKFDATGPSMHVLYNTIDEHESILHGGSTYFKK